MGTATIDGMGFGEVVAATGLDSQQARYWIARAGVRPIRKLGGANVYPTSTPEKIRSAMHASPRMRRRALTGA